ncbi:MAG TPA: molybdate ABC transporter substrate-binding protein [Anaerolineales bacterium]|nr:molybdate ABC transporter substrate-binding protein [Anaerolineales bacterium]
MKRIFPLLLLFALFGSACSPAVTATPGRASAPPAAEAATSAPTPTPAPRTLTVYAAASLTDAFDEIGRAFEASHPGVTVQFSFAGSQTLRAQIEQGAPVDIFASANTKEMDTLVGEHKVDSNAPQIFLTNRLVVILPANNPAGISSLQDLARPGTKIVLAAASVPAGSYALQVLDNLNAQYGSDFKTRVLANVVSSETDVKQVVAKVQLGEADAGIVYISDSVAAPGLQKIIIPADANVIARYPIAAVAGSANSALAQLFIAYVLSADGQATLQKWGFTSVSQ